MNRAQSSQTKSGWRRLVTVRTTDPDQQRVGRFLLVFALGLVAFSITGLFFTIVSSLARVSSGPVGVSTGIVVTTISLLFGLVVFGLARTGRTALSAWLFLLGFEALIVGSILWVGIGNAVPLLLIIPTIAASALLGPRASLAFGLGNTLFLISIYAATESGLFTPPNPGDWAIGSLQYQSVLASVIGVTGFYSWLTARSLSAIRQTRETAAELQRYQSRLEQQVAARTADLVQRSHYLQASTEIGRAVASLLDVDELVRQVVEVIRERFGLYYVALFVVDQRREQAVLRGATGQTGQARLARGYQLPLDGQSSMIAWSIVNAQPRIAQEAEKDEVRFVSPELPDTRSEVALPLRSRGQVIGALSLQSDRPNAFDEDTLAILQVMADQVALALDNARLFAESEAALGQVRRAYGELTQRAWAELLRDGQVVGYRYEKSGVVPVEGEWEPAMLEVIQSGHAVIDNGDAATLAVPLRVRDHIIGVLNLRRASPDKTWTEEERVLIEALAEQMGGVLESARLYQDSQRRAAREQMAGEITGRVREAVEIEVILERALRELGHAFEAERGTAVLALHEQEEG